MGIFRLGKFPFSFFKILRTKTKKQIIRKVSEKNLTSYLGVLSHVRGKRIKSFINKSLYGKIRK